MKKEPEKISTELKTLQSSQPSIIRNTILISILQALSIIGALATFGYSFYTYTWKWDKADPSSLHQSYLMSVITVLLLVIWKLTRMVKNRNFHISKMNRFIDGNT